MVKNRLTLPYDTDILEEFGGESKVWDARAGKHSLRTPDTVHIPEAFRCFAFLVWSIYENNDQMLNQETGFVMPQHAGTPAILKIG
jgi:hypothetical protein